MIKGITSKELFERAIGLDKTFLNKIEEYTNLMKELKTFEEIKDIEYEISKLISKMIEYRDTINKIVIKYANQLTDLIFIKKYPNDPNIISNIKNHGFKEDEIKQIEDGYEEYLKKQKEKWDKKYGK